MRYESRSHRNLLLFVALFVATALSSESSYGATYRVESCLKTGDVAAMAGWSTVTETTDAATFSSLLCDTDGLFNVANAAVAHARGSTIGLRWTAAPGTTVVAYDFDHRVEAFSDPNLIWGWEYRTGIVDAATLSPLLVEYCRNYLTSCESENAMRIFDETRLNHHKGAAVFLKVQCTTALPGNCPAGYESGVVVHSAHFTIEDVDAPRFLSPPAGELLDSATVASGLADVRYSVSDVGGGLYSVSIEVDGQRVLTRPVDDHDGRCRIPFSDPQPCAATAHGALQFDTSSLGDGFHSVRVIVTDATGANATSYGPIEILTINGRRLDLPRLQALACASDTLTSALRVRPRRIRFGRATIVRGRIRDASTSSVVAIVANTGDSVARLTRVDGQGRFRAKVHPARSLGIHAILLTPGQPPRCTPSTKVLVSALSTLRASTQRLHNRRVLNLSGDISGAVPATGKRVVIRVRGAGSHQWFRAGVVRSDAEGAWSWRYRFKRTLQPTTYIFQALLPRQTGFPYQRGWSPSVRIKVVP